MARQGTITSIVVLAQVMAAASVAQAFGRFTYGVVLPSVRDDLLGSCKWDRRAPAATLSRLLEHQAALPRAGSARLAIFARGFSAALKRRAEEEGVELIGIERLFA